MAEAARLQAGLVGRIKKQSPLIRFVLGLAFRFKLWRIRSGAAADKVRAWWCVLWICRIRSLCAQCWSGLAAARPSGSEWGPLHKA